MAMRPGQTSRSRRGERVVQLAPACLAIVLGRESEPEGERMAAAGQAREPWPSGYQLFADFKAANASRFWDTRVSAGVRAARLAGWLHGGALLVRGERAQLDALRDAWGRRALRPPSGFTIRHVGDVRPILMVPAAQSHFIPLGDVLCAAIAQLSGRQQPVTQERLLQYLDQAFPGVPTPNQEVLHSTLGSLIKERKIYHTGEGYFIVTPQTYYVTSSLIRDDKKWVRSERDSPETCFPVLTPSNENNDCWQSPFGAHCLSCQCFHAEGNVSGEAKVEDKDGGLPMDVHNEKAQTKCTIEEKSKKVEKVNAKDLTANGVNGVRAESGRWKGKGVTSESKRRQLIGALPMLAEKNKKSDEKDSPASSGSGCKDKNHDLILSKAEREREGDKISKVFGLRLFRRSSQRKEKIPRKEHATFSAQFPPIEWPVRDEESQENLPRHLEHQIIRRINPELTVQNLLRHTALLEHVTSQATSRDAGTSTVVPAMRSRDKTRATNRRLASSGSRIRSRTHASRRRARALSSKVSSADEAVCHREETTEKPWPSRDLREQWIGPVRPHSDEDILVDEAGHVSGQGVEEIPSWLQSWQRTQNNGDVVKRLSRRKGCACRNNEGGHARKDHKAHHLKIRSKSVEPSKSKISMKHDFATAGDQHVTSHGGHQNALSNGLENTPNATTAQCEVTEKLMHGTFSTSNGINYQGFSRTQPIHHQRRPEITRKLYHFEPSEKDSCSLVNADIDGNQKNKDCDCNITDATGCTADYFNNNESRETILCAPEKPRTFKKHVRKEKQFRRNEGLNEVQDFVTVNSFVCKAIGEGNVHKKVHMSKEHCSGEVAKINEVVSTQEAQRGLTCESESFTDEDCQLYVQDIQEDSDGSSLCLNEEDGSGDSPNSPLQVSGSYHCPPVHFLNKIEDSPTPCPSAIARDAGNSSQHQEMLMDRFNDSINGVFSNNRAVETTNFRDDQDVIAHRVQDGSKQERSGVTRVRGKQLQISTPLMRLEEDIVEGFAGEIEGSIFDCNPNTEAEAFLEMANDDDEISDILSPRQSQGTLSQGDFECHRESTDQEGFNENPCLVSPDSSVSSTMDSGLPPSRAENTDLHNFIISSRSSSPRNGKFLTPSASMKMNTVKMQCQTTTNITSISGSSRNQNTTSEASELQTRLDHASKNTQDNTSQTVLRRTDNSVFIALKHEAPVNGMPLSKVSGNEQPADTDQWGQQSRPEQQKALATLRTRLARPLQEEQPSISNLEPQNMELGWTSGLSSRQIQSGSHLVNMSRTDSGTVGSREITGATFSLSPTINV